MKKFILIALLGMFFIGGSSAVFAQGDDSTELSLDEPQDTISIDDMDPTYYEEEAPEESSNATTYAIIGGIVIIGGAAFYFMSKKKK